MEVIHVSSPSLRAAGPTPAYVYPQILPILSFSFSILLLLYTFTVCSLIIQRFFLSPLSSKLCFTVLYRIITFLVNSISFLQREKIFLFFVYFYFCRGCLLERIIPFYSMPHPSYFIFYFISLFLFYFSLRSFVSLWFIILLLLCLLPVLSIPSMTISDIHSCCCNWCETIDLRRLMCVICISKIETFFVAQEYPITLQSITYSISIFQPFSMEKLLILTIPLFENSEKEMEPNYT